MMKPRTRAQTQPTSSSPPDEIQVQESLHLDSEGSVTKLVLSYGMQKFQAVQYNTFDVGPFQVEVQVTKGADIAALKSKAMRMLKQMFDEAYTDALQSHLDHIKQASATARSR